MKASRQEALRHLLAVAQHELDAPAGLTTEQAAEQGCWACRAQIELDALADVQTAALALADIKLAGESEPFWEAFLALRDALGLGEAE